MAKEIGIYSITSPTGKLYVGQSTDLCSRERCYKNNWVKSQPRISNSIEKHGWESHKFEVIFKPFDTSPESLTRWEQFFMDYYRSEGVELMNLREAGANGKMSEESIKKRSGVNHHQYGKKVAWFGKKAHAQMLEKYNGVYPISVSVHQYTKEGKFIRTWPCIMDVEKELKFSAVNITKCCRSAKWKKSAGGFMWRYAQGNLPIDIPPMENNQFHPIDQLKEGKLVKSWSSIKEAAAYCKVKPASVLRWINGERKPSNGFEWRYKNTPK